MADISRIHPIFKFKLDLILADLKLLGWEPIIASGVRTPAEQAEKVKQGVSQTMHSWHVLGTAQMIPAGRAAIDVVHGSAADVVDRRYGWDGRASNKDFQFWKDLGRIAKKHGCEWGGDWKMRDVAHVQMRFVETVPFTTVTV